MSASVGVDDSLLDVGSEDGEEIPVAVCEVGAGSAEEKESEGAPGTGQRTGRGEDSHECMVESHGVSEAA
jgi:hypothetical protein